MFLNDDHVLQHVEGVSVGLHGRQALLLAVHLQEAVVVQADHLGFESVLAPEAHLTPAVPKQRTQLSVPGVPVSAQISRSENM